MKAKKQKNQILIKKLVIAQLELELSSLTDYGYGNLEQNLVRPESEQHKQSQQQQPIHTHITAKYTTSISSGSSAASHQQQQQLQEQRQQLQEQRQQLQEQRQQQLSELDDAATAEEYVSKAMQIYGTRLREPIRIAEESTLAATPVVDVPSQAAAAAASTSSDNSNSYDYYYQQQTQRYPLEKVQQYCQLHELQIDPQSPDQRPFQQEHESQNTLK